jgi:hypothetical protein
MAPLTEICQWAAGIPVWEQETLRRLLAEEPFDEATYFELVSLLLGEKNQEPVDFSGFEAPAAAADGPPILLRLAGTQNVNALAPDQRLEFSPGLTVIFGNNGSGKSGYARILGNACFCRGDRDVLPNFFDSVSQNSPQSVDITISVSGRESTIRHDFQNRIAALSGFYVFDSTAVGNHLSKENALSFSPFGLSLLRDLVGHTDHVRTIAQNRIDAACAPHTFLPLFREDSPVRRVIAQLGEPTEIEEIKRIAQLTPEEQEEKREAEAELAELRSQNIPSSIQAIKTEISQLRRLREQILEIDNALSESKVDAIRIALSDVEAKQVQAKEAGSSYFANPKLKKTGSDAWMAFVRAARNLASEEGEYPNGESVCLLCQQPLSADAVALLERLWEFLAGEARRLLKESENVLAAKAVGVKSLQTNVCSPETAIHQILSEKSGELLGMIERFLIKSSDRRDAVVNAIDLVPGQNGSERLSLLPPRDQAPIGAMDALLGAWEKEVEELKTRDTTKRIGELTILLREFEHRQILAENLPAIEEYAKGLEWAGQAQKNIKNSRHITKAHNELFEKQVSSEYRVGFERYIKALGRPLRVKIETRGAKGTALKALQLILPEGVKHPKAAPQYILCEGEKRAVALADFLAEVSIDPASAGIVLDDPVTSLDQDWKEQMASVLVAESKVRQVIIFTHDLYFLYLLKNAAERTGAQYQAHWIEKHSSANTCGHIALNASPASEKDFRNTNPAEKYLKAAKEATDPPKREAALRSGFGALRTTYEQFVLSDMFNEVVRRFDSRISIDRLKDARVDPATVQKVMQKVGELSRYIEGHSHSDEAAHAPTIEALAKEIEEFKVLKSQQKAAKKATIQANLVSD